MAPNGEVQSQLESALASALQNRWDETERLCRLVIAAGPTDPNIVAVARKYRAVALGLVGYKITADRGRCREMLQEALQEGRRAVHAYAKSSEPAQNTAGAHGAVGSAILFMITREVIMADEWPALYPEGMTALRKAVELDPQDEQARKNLGLLGGMDRVAKMRGAKTGGCFIATACYGDPLAPQVALLCTFRDEVLSKTAIGRAFSRAYYRLSPAIASMIVKSEYLRRISMVLVVWPAVALVHRLRRIDRTGLRYGPTDG